MDTLNIILFIVLILLILVEIAQYREVIRANLEFQVAARKYQTSFNDMADTITINAKALANAVEIQEELRTQHNNMATLLDLHSEILNLRLLQGLLTKNNPE